MKTVLPEASNTVEEAKAFLTALYNNGEAYHPEDNAHSIIWELPEEQKPTASEADKLNKLSDDMYAIRESDQSFDPCEVLMNLYNPEQLQS